MAQGITKLLVIEAQTLRDVLYIVEFVVEKATIARAVHRLEEVMNSQNVLFIAEIAMRKAIT